MKTFEKVLRQIIQHQLNSSSFVSGDKIFQELKLRSRTDFIEVIDYLEANQYVKVLRCLQDDHFSSTYQATPLGRSFKLQKKIDAADKKRNFLFGLFEKISLQIILSFLSGYILAIPTGQWLLDRVHILLQKLLSLLQ